MKLIIRLLIFLAPLAVIYAYVEHRLFIVPNSYNKKLADLEKQASKIEVLVVGSSQSLYGIDPGYFSSPGYNLANSSQSLYYDKELVLKEIDKLKHLKLVVIPVSYFSLYYRLEDSEEAWRAYYYYRFWDISNRQLGYFDLRKYSLLALYTPSVSASILLKRGAGDFANGITENGFDGRDTSGNDHNIGDESGRQRVRFHNKLISKGNFDEVSHCFSQLVQALTDRGIKVAVVTPPVYATYYRYVDTAVVARSRQFIDSICRGAKAGYVDYLADKRFFKG